MARFKTFGEVAEYISQGNVTHIIPLTVFELASGNLLLWDGDYPLDFLGDEWLPTNGTLQFTESVMEDETSAQPFEFTALPKDFEFIRVVATNFDAEAKRRRVVRYISFFDENHQPLIQQIWATKAGFMDRMQWSETAGQRSVTISIEDVLATQRYPNLGYYTDYHLRQRYPNARGLEHYSSLDGRDVNWRIPT